MLPRGALAGLAGLLVSRALASGLKDLGSVLESDKELTQYFALIKRYPDILLQLPSYKGVTMVAPTDRAFDNIPYTALNAVWDPADRAQTVPLLQYHVLQGTVSTASLDPGPSYVQATLLKDASLTNVTAGQGVLVNKQPGDAVVFTSGLGTRCTLVGRELAFQGGLVQVVDNLLVPPARLGRTALAFQLSSFLGSLYAARLMPDLADRKNITVFAPRDAAFALVGGGLEHLPPSELARVMSYHVVPGQVLASAALSNGSSLETLAVAPSGTSQESVLIRQAGNNKYVNSAQIVQPDILIANGILHVISNVLNPDAPSEAPDPKIGNQPPVFPVNSAEHPFTSSLPCSTDCPVTTSHVSSTEATASTSATVTSFSSRSSKAGAAPAACTAHVAGAAAMGLLGLGAGLVPWI